MGTLPRRGARRWRSRRRDVSGGVPGRPIPGADVALEQVDLPDSSYMEGRRGPTRAVERRSVGHNDLVSDIPRRAASRTAKLAALPLGFAGRTALGLGKRAVGIATDAISADIQQRTAEQLFSVLGQLKGGAMKFGQALSVFEAAMPEEMAGPYRQALTKLQEAAPPMPVSSVHRTMAEQLGPDWRQRFTEFDDSPAAAASIGQVHRAVWKLPPARRNAKPKTLPVAVKVQYPGAGDALLADLRQLSRLAGMFKIIQPGMDIKPLLAELRDRITEELDYEMEAETQRAFAAAYADDPEIRVPRVVASAPRVLVTEWVDGTPLAKVISDGSEAERDEAGRLMATLHFSAPARAGLLHADPHPGNFRILPDGRLGVIDFGAVARLPGGYPEPLGRLTRYAVERDAAAVLALLREQGFIRSGIDLDARQVMDYLGPIVEPLRTPSFTFSREWMREQANRLGDPRREEARVGQLFNLPPSYLLIHRVTIGSI